MTLLCVDIHRDPIAVLMDSPSKKKGQQQQQQQQGKANES
jgi:hypothetical protein